MSNDDSATFTPTQDVESLPLNRYPSRSSGVIGLKRLRSQFVAGGALDSQTSDSQYIKTLTAKENPCSISEQTYTSVGVQASEHSADISMSCVKCEELQQELTQAYVASNYYRTQYITEESRVRTLEACLAYFGETPPSPEKSQLTLDWLSPAKSPTPSQALLRQTANQKLEEFTQNTQDADEEPESRSIAESIWDTIAAGAPKKDNVL